MNDRTTVNDKKKLVIAIIALVVIIAVALAIYNGYRDRVDPLTGEVSTASQAMAEASTATNAEGIQEAAAMASEAPDFTMQDASGKEVKLSDFRGKPVVLNFWTSWCDYCKSEMPYFESAYQQYGDRVQFIMLNLVKSERSTDGGKNFIKESSYTFPVFYETEGRAMNLYGLRGFPATVFIDANGTIVEKNIGAISETKLNDNINKLLG